MEIKDLANEDLVLRGMFVSEATTLDRTLQGKQNLTFVRFVGAKTMAVTPKMLYFGDLTEQQLLSLRGKPVDVLLQASDKGFNAGHVQPAK